MKKCLNAVVILDLMHVSALVVDIIIMSITHKYIYNPMDGRKSITCRAHQQTSWTQIQI